MRWAWIFLAMVLTATMLMLLLQLALGEAEARYLLTGHALVSSLVGNALLVPILGAIGALPLWLMFRQRIGDRPLAWALVGAFAGSILILAAAAMGAACGGGPLCPLSLTGSVGFMLKIAGVMAIGGAITASAGLAVWRATRPAEDARSRDVRF